MYRGWNEYRSMGDHTRSISSISIIQKWNQPNQRVSDFNLFIAQSIDDRGTQRISVPVLLRLHLLRIHKLYCRDDILLLPFPRKIIKIKYFCFENINRMEKERKTIKPARQDKPLRFPVGCEWKRKIPFFLFWYTLLFTLLEFPSK